MLVCVGHMLWTVLSFSIEFYYMKLYIDKIFDNFII